MPRQKEEEMNSTERAEKICQIVVGYWDSVLVAKVAAQIEEAELQKVIEQRDLWKSRADRYEKALREIANDPGDDDKSYAFEQIAKSALAPEETK